MNEVLISFPGLGIGEFTINKIAFSIGSLHVRWYGIIIAIGIVAGVLYAMYRAKHEGMKADDVLDYALWVIVSAVIGARVYYVVTDSGTTYHSFYDIIAIWEGGLAIYGAVIAGAAAILVVSLVKKYNKTKMFKMFDMVSPGVMLGQIIGRWGNFCNGEAHGIMTSENFFLRMGLAGGADIDSKYQATITTYYHPTFLYESVWNLIGFVLINVLYKKKKFDGQIVLMYLAWYGLGRCFIEGLRTDSLMIYEFRVSQVVGALCFAVCTGLLIYFLVRAYRKKKDSESYDTVYDKLRGVSVHRAETKEALEPTLVDQALEAKKEGDAPVSPVDAILQEQEEKTVAEGEEKEN